MKRRSGEAMAALGRKAGPMGHRLQPRGGARNEQEEYMADAEEPSLIDELIAEAEARHKEHEAEYRKFHDDYDSTACDVWWEVITWLQGKR